MKQAVAVQYTILIIIIVIIGSSFAQSVKKDSEQWWMDKAEETIDPFRRFDYYDSVLQINPQSVKAITFQAEILGKFKDYERALLFVNKAITLDPSFGYAYFCKAQILMSTGEFKKGITNVDRAISRDPQNEGYHIFRSVFYEKAGAPQKSIEALADALAINPDNTESLLSRASLFLDEHNYTAANKDLLHFMSLEEPNSKVLETLADSYAKQEKYDSSVVILEEHKYVYKDNDDVYFFLLGFYSSLGLEFNDAFLYFKKAIKAGFSNSEVLKKHPHLAPLRQHRKYRRFADRYL